MGIPEAIADTLGYSHYTTKPTIEYVNVALPDERLKLLKSYQDLQYIIELKNNLEKAGLLFDEELNNPFKHNYYKAYFNRPKEIEDLTFIAFRKGWKYTTNFTLVPKRCKDILNPSYFLAKNQYYYPRPIPILLTYFHPTLADGNFFIMSNC